MNEGKRLRNPYSNWAILTLLFWLGGASCLGADEQTVSAGAILRPVVTGARVVPSRVRAGFSIEAEFSKPVYCRDQEVIPAGSALRVIVEQAKKTAEPRRGWPRQAAAFITNSPRQTPAYAISLRSAELTVPGGSPVPIDVAVLAVLDQKRVSVRGENVRKGESKREKRRSTLVLEVKRNFALRMPETSSILAPGKPASSSMILPAGTRAAIMLLTPLSGSASREGDAIEARVLQPVMVDGAIAIPEGSRIEGRLARRKGPRRLSRAAALRLSFSKLVLSTGKVEVSTSISAAEADAGSGLHASVDAEGGISGGATSKKRLILDLGLSYLTGKIADDLLEEGVKYALGASVSGGAATAARYVGLGTGLVFFAMQRGNDVRLPQYTELEVTFSRPVALSVGSPGAPPP
jgi:hypothetical protein